MSWIPQNSRTHFIYGAGTWSKYYWDINYNPVANTSYCLANCTCLCYGRAIENGWSAPVTYVANASLWNTYVNTSGGWIAIPYSSGMQLKAGDIVQWIANNHVATIEEDGTDPYQSSSWWTSRNTSQTLQQISNYFQSTTSLQYRFYHYTKLSVENVQGGGGYEPDYVLRYTKDNTSRLVAITNRLRKKKNLIRRFRTYVKL